jgi:hypothetical protein
MDERASEGCRAARRHDALHHAGDAVWPCASAASGASVRPRARTTVSPIGRMGSSVEDGWRESSRRLGDRQVGQAPARRRTGTSSKTRSPPTPPPRLAAGAGAPGRTLKGHAAARTRSGRRERCREVKVSVWRHDLISLAQRLPTPPAASHATACAPIRCPSRSSASAPWPSCRRSRATRARRERVSWRSKPSSRRLTPPIRGEDLADRHPQRTFARSARTCSTCSRAATASHATAHTSASSRLLKNPTFDAGHE